MTAPANELQKLIYDEITGDANIMAKLTAMYDRVPGDAAYPYGSFGPRQRLPEDAGCINASSHRVQLDFWSRTVGATECEAIVDLVKRKFNDAALSIADNALVTIRVTMDSVTNDPDGLTNHGLVMIEALIEERP